MREACDDVFEPVRVHERTRGDAVQRDPVAVARYFGATGHAAPEGVVAGADGSAGLLGILAQHARIVSRAGGEGCSGLGEGGQKGPEGS